VLIVSNDWKNLSSFDKNVVTGSIHVIGGWSHTLRPGAFCYVKDEKDLSVVI
jgi:hypothetical protein